LKFLFIGANNPGVGPELSLSKEFKDMEKAFYEVAKHTSREWGECNMVHFEYVFFADASELSEHLIQVNPTILHFACHGDPGQAHSNSFDQKSPSNLIKMFLIPATAILTAACSLSLQMLFTRNLQRIMSEVSCQFYHWPQRQGIRYITVDIRSIVVSWAWR